MLIILLISEAFASMVRAHYERLYDLQLTYKDYTYV